MSTSFNPKRFERLLAPGPWESLPPGYARNLAAFRAEVERGGIERGTLKRAAAEAGTLLSNFHNSLNNLLRRAERWDALRARSVEPLAGLDIRSVSTTHDRKGRVRATSVRQGLPSQIEAPQLSADHPSLNPGPGTGYMVRGTTTLIDGEGNPRAQYVMVRRDEAQKEAQMRAVAEALKADLPQYPEVKKPKKTVKPLLNLYTITDYHFGMRAWHEETGADWDLAIADRTLDAAVKTWFARVPDAATAILNFGGDTLHYDGFKPVTPESGHLLDADSRMEKMVRVSVSAIRRTVARALEKHGRVILLMQEGNHDQASSVWLRVMLAHVYEAEPRVEVITSPLPYYAHRHGAWLLGFHHGHLKKPDGLPLLFAAQFREMWGQTKRAHIHCGHLHHIYEKEHPGAVVTQHPTLAAPDAYATRGGWLSERQALAHTYHEDGELVCVTPVAPALARMAA